MTEKIGLEAVLLTDQFAAGVKTYDSGIDAMEAANESFVGSADDVTEGLSAVDDAANESGKSAVDLAAKIEIAEKAYDQIKDTIGQAIELADLGSQANRAEERFRSFAGEVGDADQLLAAFNRGAGGTVDKLTAMTSAGRLLQMGLVSNNDEMEQVVEMATRLGDQTQSAGDRVADFAALLANQSIPRLDNFGISSGKVRARIEELQKAFPGMSREVAFSKAVFEQGAVSLDILGTRTQDAGAKMEVARANIENMRIEMGQRLLPIVASAFGLIENLNTGTLALLATLGGAAGVFVKFSGGLEGAAANAGKLATKMGTSTAALGALAVSMVVLVEAAGNLSETLSDMNAVQDSAQEAAASLGDKVQALVDDGMSLGEAMAQVGVQVNTATEEFNNATVLGVIPLKNALNAGSEFSKTMAEATNSLQGAIVSNTESYGAYIEQVNAYNVGITDSEGKLALLSEAEFRMEEARVKGASAASLLADEILKESLALDDTGTAADRAFPILDQYNQNQERGAQKAEQMAGAVAENAAQIQASSSVVDANAAAIAARASMEEKAARIEDMQAASALAASAALEEKRKKDIETVQAEQALAQSVLNASDAMIAQTFISGLDPDAMGLTAYRQAVENIQLAFGLATPESIRLAQGINQGIDAMNDGAIAAGDMDDFIKDLIADSETGADTFEKYSIAVEDSASASNDLALKSSALAGELPAVDAGAEQAAEGMDNATESTRELETAMGDAAAAAPGHGAAIGSGLRSGMEPQMDGFVASFRAKLQTLKDQLPSSEPKDSTSPLYGLDESGEAIVGNIVLGIGDAESSAVDAMTAVGESMGQAFVSAIGDSTEDLFDAAGVLGGLGSAAGGLFQARTVGPLEDALAGLEQSAESARQQYEQLGEEQLSIQEALAESSDLSLTRLIRLFEVDPSQLTFEQIFMLSRMNELARERQHITESINATEEKIVATAEELVAQQERLAKLQQQQENLRFLEQQADLLELIAEKGLDAGQILGGLQLGIDADAGLVMDAMAAAMQQIIEQAEEELGIASPSKVFEQIGRNTMRGMAMGIEELMSLPVAQSALAAQSMIAAPASIASQGNVSTDNSMNFDININGADTSNMGQARAFSTAIIRDVKDSMRGVS